MNTRIAEMEQLIERDRDRNGKPLDEGEERLRRKIIEDLEKYADELAQRLGIPPQCGPATMDPWDHDGLNKLADNPKAMQKAYIKGLQDAAREFGNYAEKFAMEKAQEAAIGVGVGAAIGLGAKYGPTLYNKAADYYRYRKALKERLRPKAVGAAPYGQPLGDGSIPRNPHAPRSTALVPVGKYLTTVDDVLANPQLLSGKTAADVQAILGKTPGWRVETLGKGAHQGQGWVLREYNVAGNPTGQMLRWHPGGGHHGPDPYWRVNTHNTKSPIIPAGPES